ncbi:protein kinase domain-containing protein [Polyangium aurulentum]|uniref:protein kinase domain-containing protein n=1 Tax=Polyangium aurulentum TaxID=2567896 RepID=UPI00146F48B8|nr:protein kinase [Polyangium aurulentum]UQA55412.1 protein kinase [Polyangium aurulentum]
MKGEVLVQRFEIEKRAGVGGMGVVYRAHDRESGAPVAVKVLSTEAAPSDTERFLREAKMLARLRHPFIVRHLGHGLTPEGAPYLVMEWLEGEDLRRRLLRGSLSVQESLTLCRRVADALAHAHAQGIVHRDLKPANLYLCGGDVDRVKILDFGIACALAATRVTRTGTFLGTPGYMAPEQARASEDVDARADVFSLGCVLFECLAGRPAFSGGHVLALLAKVLFEDPPRISELRDDVPPALEALVMRMLARDPIVRPANGEKLVEALASIDAEDDGFAVQDVPPSVIARREQQLFSVILAQEPATEADPSARTLAADAVSEPLVRLQAGLAAFPGRVEGLADGSVIITLMGRGAATDLASQAARCALAARKIIPEARVVLATGRGALEGKLPVGEVIERAAELIRTRFAEPGGAGSRGPRPIALDELSARLLERTFAILESAEGFELHGERALIEMDTERTLLGKPTPCVGRDRELHMLRGLLEECLSEPVARVVLVTGAAGAGKSRVVRELLRGVRRDGAPCEIWVARGDPLEANSPLGMASQLVRRAAGLFGGEPLEVRRDKIRARVERSAPGAEARAIAPFLGELAGAPFPDEDDIQLTAARRDPVLLGERMANAWDDFLAAACGAGPVLIVLEDLHWGDLPSARLVDRALRSLRDRPLFVLATARPDVYERFPRLWQERDFHEVRLGDLPRRASERLVRFMLGEDADPEVVERVVAQAGGNAFYLEELIRVVAEGRRGALPTTVLAMVLARLEAIEPEARLVLRTASIFGEVFWRGGISALLEGALSEEALDRALASLSTGEFLAHHKQSAFLGEEQYAFRHALVREAAHGTLTPEATAHGHRLAGIWLEGAGARDALVLAEHFERGEDLPRAAAFYVRAAEQAMEANDLAGVLARVERAAECGAKGPLLGAARRIEGEARVWLGEFAQAMTACEQAMALLPRDEPAWYSALSSAATAAWSRGKQERLSYFCEMLDDEPPSDPEAVVSRAAVTARLALLSLRAGRTADARRLFQRLDPLEETVKGDPIVTARVHDANGWRAVIEGDPSASGALFAQASAAFERAGDLRSACSCRVSAAMALMHLGGYADAKAALDEALAFAERYGLPNVRARVQQNLGRVLAHLGKLEEARRMEQEALVAFFAQGDYWFGVTSRIYLSRILLRMGRLEEAAKEAQEASGMVRGVSPLSCMAAIAIASVALRQGQALAAMSLTTMALHNMNRLGKLEEDEALARLMFAEAAWASGSQARAREAIAVARKRLLDRAEKIGDPAWRASFLERVPENARTIELSRAWIDESTSPGEKAI